jgi:two-component system, NarL family, nitrate/nitrite response regulator NarL
MIIIASPSRATRRRWQEALAGTYPTHEVAEREWLEKALAELKPEVLLLDLDQDRFGGLRRMHALIRLSPMTRVILFRGKPIKSEGVTAIKGGAKGYCSKNFGPPALLRKAVETVRNGEIWVGRDLGSALVEELVLSNFRHKYTPERDGASNHSDDLLSGLSPRERQIAEMISWGERNKEIANRLNISEKTVKAHLTMIFRKLGLSDRLQLALYLNRFNPFGHRNETTRGISSARLEQNVQNKIQ